jgi:hypothetical protein
MCVREPKRRCWCTLGVARVVFARSNDDQSVHTFEDCGTPEGNAFRVAVANGVVKVRAAR